jgi:hypothetical protein
MYRETVPSIGFGLRHHLPFANGHQTIRVFRQALSLDEASKFNLPPPLLAEIQFDLFLVVPHWPPNFLPK